MLLTSLISLLWFEFYQTHSKDLLLLFSNHLPHPFSVSMASSPHYLSGQLLQSKTFFKVRYFFCLVADCFWSWHDIIGTSKPLNLIIRSNSRNRSLAIFRWQEKIKNVHDVVLNKESKLTPGKPILICILIAIVVGSIAHTTMNHLHIIWSRPQGHSSSTDISQVSSLFLELFVCIFPDFFHRHLDRNPRLLPFWLFLRASFPRASSRHQSGLYPVRLQSPKVLTSRGSDLIKPLCGSQMEAASTHGVGVIITKNPADPRFIPRTGFRITSRKSKSSYD